MKSATGYRSRERRLPAWSSRCGFKVHRSLSQKDPREASILTESGVAATTHGSCSVLCAGGKHDEQARAKRRKSWKAR